MTFDWTHKTASKKRQELAVRRIQQQKMALWKRMVTRKYQKVQLRRNKQPTAQNEPNAPVQADESNMNNDEEIQVLIDTLNDDPRTIFVLPFLAGYGPVMHFAKNLPMFPYVIVLCAYAAFGLYCLAKQQAMVFDLIVRKLRR